ncbi:hypothetical protein QE408_000278 [Agrobacterium larrymoorei]|uniref:Uncharacterized protein n=1 Tax=Agrobacterium larrymoorei TaxID=160699 RepID=A0ABU0UDZ6_9HYPH|nr:hypothetical protein [Agrobacterium larrymoorei]
MNNFSAHSSYSVIAVLIVATLCVLVLSITMDRYDIKSVHLLSLLKIEAKDTPLKDQNVKTRRSPDSN